MPPRVPRASRQARCARRSARSAGSASTRTISSTTMPASNPRSAPKSARYVGIQPPFSFKKKGFALSNFFSMGQKSSKLGGMRRSRARSTRSAGRATALAPSRIPSARSNAASAASAPPALYSMRAPASSRTSARPRLARSARTRTGLAPRRLLFPQGKPKKKKKKKKKKEKGGGRDVEKKKKGGRVF